MQLARDREGWTQAFGLAFAPYVGDFRSRARSAFAPARYCSARRNNQASSHELDLDRPHVSFSSSGFGHFVLDIPVRRGCAAGSRTVRRGCACFPLAWFVLTRCPPSIAAER